MSLAASHPLRPIALVARLTWLDFMRRKDFYVVAVFMLLYVIATLAVRTVGVETADTARFLMSLGLNLAYLLTAFLAASFSARAFPEEFDRGTLAPLLAKPVDRAQVMAGKIGVCTAIACGSYLAFALATLLAVPHAPGQGVAAFLQVVVLQVLSLSILSVLAAALSLYMPAVVAALAALLWQMGAGFAVGLVRESARVHSATWGAVAERLLSCLPDPTLLKHVETFAQGAQPMPWRTWGALALYALLWAALLYGWASWRFRRMRI